MPRQPADPAREERIELEVVVDADDPEEQASAWHCYLEDRLAFPFAASCVTERRTSPLQVGERVSVLAMAPDECEHEMFVTIYHGGRPLDVPLAQLQAVGEDEGTTQALADWHYWHGRYGGF